MQRSARCFLALLGALAAAGCGSQGTVDTSSRGTGGATVITGAGGGGFGGAGATTTATNASSVTTSSGASSGGAGGGAFACPPTPPAAGPTISAPAHQWTWIPVEGAKCRDGSGTGIGIRMSPASTKLYIYLEGGGACFNAATCAISLASFGSAEFNAWAGTVGQTGIFDPNNGENPVQDWNAIYVPYCSADVHAGDATGANVNGGGPTNQDFLGYENVGAALARIVPTFPNLTQVLLTGISAGGFGAAMNYDRVASAFCPVPVALVDDSGPPMSDGYLAPCLQEQWRSLWNLEATLPAGCGCTTPNGGGIVNYVTYLADRWPNSQMGLISSTHDAVISAFFGYGTNDCTASTPIPPDVYAAGLQDLRQNYMSKSGLWGTYFIDSIQHTWLLGPGFYTTVVNGKALPAWIGDLLAGQPSNVGP
jgi:hypothetical protein